MKGHDRSRNARARRVCFTPSAPEYRALARLAKYHRRTVAGLMSEALTGVIEKYRVLRGLDRRIDEMAMARRRR